MDDLRHNRTPLTLFAFLILFLVQSVASTTTCDTLYAFYSDASISDKQLYKFTRTLVKFSKATVNYPLHTVAKRLKAELVQCKDTSSTPSRIVDDVSRRALSKTVKTVLGSGDPLRLRSVTRATTEEEQESMQRMCESLHERKRAMGIDSLVEQTVYNTYLLSSKTKKKNDESPRSLASLAAAVTGPDMSMLDLYEAMNEMLLSVPSHSTTCSKLCPCAVVDTSQKLCARPRVRGRDGRCVEIDEFDTFGDRGEIAIAETDETRCPTVAIEEQSPGECVAGTPPWKQGYALFTNSWDNALCYHYHPDYYCDPSEPFKCAEGLYSPLKCCKTKCLVKLCEKRRDLYETFGYVNLYRAGRCVLKGLAADVSFNVIKQHEHCKAVCEETYKD